MLIFKLADCPDTTQCWYRYRQPHWLDPVRPCSTYSTAPTSTARWPLWAPRCRQRHRYPIQARSRRATYPNESRHKRRTHVHMSDLRRSISDGLHLAVPFPKLCRGERQSRRGAMGRCVFSPYSGAEAAAKETPKKPAKKQAAARWATVSLPRAPRCREWHRYPVKAASRDDTSSTKPRCERKSQVRMSHMWQLECTRVPCSVPFPKVRGKERQP